MTDIKISDAVFIEAFMVWLHGPNYDETVLRQKLQQALNAAAQEARRVALEEAAKECDEWYNVSLNTLGKKAIKNAAISIRALSNAPPSSPWQPIETAPKDEEVILFFPERIEQNKYGSWKNPTCAIAASIGIGRAYGSASHWMPLPNKPAGGEG